MCGVRVLFVIGVFACAMVAAGAQEPSRATENPALPETPAFVTSARQGGTQATGNSGASANDLLNRRFSLKARGDGTISTVGKTLADISLENAGVQFVIEPAAANISLPALEFRQLRLKAVLRLIEHVSGGRIRLDDNSISFEPGDESIVVLVGAQDIEQKVVKVLSVRHLLTAEVEEQDLMEAMEAGFAFLGGESKPEIRFHQKTGLVFLRGTTSEVAFVAQMVAAMSGSAGLPAGQLPGQMMIPGDVTVPGRSMMGGSGSDADGGGSLFFPKEARRYVPGVQVPPQPKVVTGDPFSGPQTAPAPKK